MSLEIQDGFLVETFPRSEVPVRRARIVVDRPEGRIQGGQTVSLNGRRYTLAYHFESGMRQGRAVAWPKGEE